MLWTNPRNQGGNGELVGKSLAWGKHGREVAGPTCIVVYFVDLKYDSVPASMRLRRRATDRESHPAEMPKLSRPYVGGSLASKDEWT